MKDQIQAWVTLDLGVALLQLDFGKKDNKCRRTKHKGELEAAF